MTDGFSGADLNEICQVASKVAIRETIEAESRFKAAQELQVGEDVQMDYDPVPKLTRKHFEESMQGARMSVAQVDLIKYEQFKKKFDPSYREGVKVSKKVNWGPGGGDMDVEGEDELYEDDEDDLYS